MVRFDRSSFLAFFAARFSLRVFPCFLLCPDGGALVPMGRQYALLEALGIGKSRALRPGVQRVS